MPTVLAVVLGGLLATLGVLLVIPLPELGLPLLLGGLRLLGRRYAWARRLTARVDRTAATVLGRYRQLPRLARWIVILLLAGLGLGAGYLAWEHFV